MPGMKRWGLVLFGAGAGAVAGVQAGRVALLPALAALVAGLLLLAVGARSGPRDLVADAAAARTAPVGRDDALSAAPGGPSPAGLGARVEEILRRAEEQAAATVAAARETAARIVAEAERAKR